MFALTIYKASAGSGKTFTLAREYLKIMFKSDNAYSGILAVTFTKKATAEMSERILKELYLLSSGKESGHLATLQEEYNISEEDVRRRAGIYLKRILHNYHWFNINTIDSFLQGILKTFTREVGLNAGFNVELNQNLVIEESVAVMFEKLHENDKLRKWLSDFANDKLNAGKSWDIQRELVDFAKTALQDYFYGLSQEQLDEIADLEKFTEYKKTLRKIVDDFSEEVINNGKEAMELMSNHGLSVADFSFGKTGVAGYFDKISKLNKYEVTSKHSPLTRIRKAAESEDGVKDWVKKKSPKEDDVRNCVQGGLQNHALKAVDLFDNKAEDFFTAKAILKEIDSYAILVEVFREVIEYCTEQNIFLLSMSSPLLANIIKEDDTPFIYEKSGQYLNSFMIDEFQDTSNVQWNNFFPLVLNSVSENNSSLVVGDVKQSIYRFRNGDWTLLDTKIKDQFSGYNVVDETLPNNWRSFGNVVDFNNQLFENGPLYLQDFLNESIPSGVLSDLDSETFTRIYSNSAQLVPLEAYKDLGKVEVNFCEKIKKEDLQEGENEFSNYLRKMQNAILELNSAGYSPGQIAILVRTKKEGAMVADFLMDQSLNDPSKSEAYSFISSESVFIKSSDVVSAVVSILQLIEMPQEFLFRANVLHILNKLDRNSKGFSDYLILENINDWEFFVEQLPQDLSSEINNLKHKSLLESIYSILAVFDSMGVVSENDNSFVNTFLDQVLVMVNNGKSDISSFVQWWNDSGANFPVQISEEQDAMRILTIHKSKGLEFDAVILPFVNWDMGMRNQETIWCKTSGKLGGIPVVPVSTSKDLELSHFKEEYYKEVFMTNVDKLNVLYVALTRAKKAMYINAQLPSDENKLTNAGALVYKVVTDNVSLRENELSYFNEDEMCFRFGKLVPEATEESVPDENVFSISKRKYNKGVVGVRLHDVDYYNLSDDDDGAYEGRLYHKIMEDVVCCNDIDIVIGKSVIKGIITKEEGDRFKSVLLEAIGKSGKEQWFAKETKVYNERTIIMSGGKQKRPDRYMYVDGKHVVVDYKFTEKATSAHKQQVREYMKLLSDMNVGEIEGYVWYIMKGELLPV